MKRVSLFLLLFFCITLMSVFSINHKPVNNLKDKPVLVPNEIVVGFYADSASKARARIKDQFNLKIKRHSRKDGEFSVFLHDNPRAVIAKLKKINGVAYAEQNAYAYVNWIHNDPYYDPYQWHMTRIGLEDAWPLSSGSGVVVAIIDTGVKQSLEDLARTRFTAGYDFINNDNDPNDDEGHGSHVCGTVAQSSHNGIGVTGAAYNCTIMPVKVLNDQGCGTYDLVADGIYWAADNGADIINLSLSGSVDLTVLRDAVDYAWNKGVVIVCAAGNSGSNVPEFPAAYPDSISVSATNYLDQLADYSNYGSTIDICAPGGDGGDHNGDGYMDGILQNTFGDSGDGYYFYTGTSMAAPHVTGAAALVKAADPSLTNSEIRSILESTARDLDGSGWNQYYGYGIVDAYEAVQEARNGSDSAHPVVKR